MFLILKKFHPLINMKLLFNGDLLLVLVLNLVFLPCLCSADPKRGYSIEDSALLSKCIDLSSKDYHDQLHANGMGLPDDLDEVKYYFINAPFSIDGFCKIGDRIVTIEQAPSLFSPRRKIHSYVLENTGIIWVNVVTLKSLVVCPPWSLFKAALMEDDKKKAPRKALEPRYQLAEEDREMIVSCEKLAIKKYYILANEQNYVAPKISEPLFSWLIRSPINIEGYCKKDEVLVVTRIGPSDKNLTQEEKLTEPIQYFALSWTNPSSNKSIFLSAPWITEKYEDSSDASDKKIIERLDK